MKQRDVYVDVAKGICILLIICIHTEVFGIIGMRFTFIAVPMFFFMSGFYDRSEKPMIEWLPRIVQRLIRPAVIWVIIGNLFMKLLGYVKTGVIEPYSFDLLNPQNGNGPVWFLIALLYSKIITGCMVRSKLPKLVLFVCSLVIGYIGATYQMPLLIDEGMAALPLYYIGKLVFPYLRTIMKNLWLNILGIGVFVFFVTTHYYYNVAPVNGLYYPNYLLAIMGAILVFIPILTFSEKLGNAKPLVALGERTLEVMLVHTLICHVTAVLLNRLFVVGSGMWICTFLVGYVFIVFISYYSSVMFRKYIPFIF